MNNLDDEGVAVMEMFNEFMGMFIEFGVLAAIFIVVFIVHLAIPAGIFIVVMIMLDRVFGKIMSLPGAPKPLKKKDEE